MATRKYPIVPNETYHVYNRSIAGLPIFQKYYEAERFLSLLKYYQYSKTPLRYSFYLRLNSEAKKLVEERLTTNPKRIKLVAYCVMPTHYHLVLRESNYGGIVSYLSLVQNGFAKYYNLRNNRTGSLFQEMFKAKRLEDEEQLIHTVRYIHLNPYSSSIIDDIKLLTEYRYSSYPSYAKSLDDNLVERSEMVAIHNGVEKMVKSTLEQADYQRSLKEEENKMFD